MTSWALGGPQLLDFRVLTAAATEFPDNTLGRLQLHFSGHGLRSGSLWSPGSPQPRLQLDVQPNCVARKYSYRMKHMPGGAPVCSHQQYRDCAFLVLDVGQGKDAWAWSNLCACPRWDKEISMVHIPRRAAACCPAPETQPRRGLCRVERAGTGHFFGTPNYSGAAAALYSFRATGQHWATFIGASLLTILEILHYLCEVFRDRVLGYFWNQTHSQRHSSTNLLQKGLGSHRTQIPHLSLDPRRPTLPCALSRLCLPQHLLHCHMAQDPV